MNIQRTSNTIKLKGENASKTQARFKLEESRFRNGRGAVKIDTNGNGKIDSRDRYLVAKESDGWRPIASLQELSTQLNRPIGELKTWTNPDPHSYRTGKIWEGELKDIFPHQGAKPEPTLPCESSVSTKNKTVEFSWYSKTPYEAPKPSKNRKDAAEAGAFLGGLTLGGLTAAVAGAAVGVELSFGYGSDSLLMAIPAGALAAIGGFAVGGATGYALGGIAGYAIGAPEGSFLDSWVQARKDTRE